MVGVRNRDNPQTKPKRKLCMYTSVGNPRSTYLFKYGYTDVPLVYKSLYKYLGVLINEHLNYNGLSDEIASRASAALGSLPSKYSMNNGICSETLWSVYN